LVHEDSLSGSRVTQLAAQVLADAPQGHSDLRAAVNRVEADGAEHARKHRGAMLWRATRQAAIRAASAAAGLRFGFVQGWQRIGSTAHTPLKLRGFRVSL